MVFWKNVRLQNCSLCAQVHELSKSHFVDNRDGFWWVFPWKLEFTLLPPKITTLWIVHIMYNQGFSDITTVKLGGLQVPSSKVGFFREIIIVAIRLGNLSTITWIDINFVVDYLHVFKVFLINSWYVAGFYVPPGLRKD